MPREKQETNRAWLLREIADLENAIAIIKAELTDGPVWPPRAGDLVRYGAEGGGVYEFTGERNESGGYNVVESVTRAPSGGVSKSAIGGGMFTLLGRGMGRTAGGGG